MKIVVSSLTLLWRKTDILSKQKKKDCKCLFRIQYTVWSSELDTLLMRYEVNFTPYRIKSVSNSLDQTVGAILT